MADYRHNLHYVTVQPVVNTINTAHTAPVPFARLLDNWILPRVVSQFCKMVYKVAKVRISLLFSMSSNTPLVYAYQIRLSIA